MSPKKLSLIYLHISIFLWGFTGIFGKIIQMSATMIVWYRLLITVVILLLISLVSKKIILLKGKNLYRAVYIGFCVLVHWILFYMAIKYSNASVGLSCISTVAVFTAFLEPLITGKKFSPFNVLLASVAAVGMYLIFYFQEFYRTGILLGLAAAFISSYFTILNSKLIKEVNSETVTIYELGSALLFLTLLLPLYHFYLPNDALVPDFHNAQLLLVFSLLCTVIPFNLSLKSLKYISAFTSTLSVNLE
ncbi:MAG: DMT family transporter, partial [Ignavibacteria bacterium]|nr:DMT family transporter [Ignavibacteria bacterium]